MGRGLRALGLERLETRLVACDSAWLFAVARGDTLYSKEYQ
jgi:hypothetical protein